MQQSKEKTELPVLNLLLSYWLSWYLDLPHFHYCRRFLCAKYAYYLVRTSVRGFSAYPATINVNNKHVNAVGLSII